MAYVGGILYSCDSCMKTLFISYGRDIGRVFERAGWHNYIVGHVCNECPSDPDKYTFGPEYRRIEAGIRLEKDVKC